MPVNAMPRSQFSRVSLWVAVVAAVAIAAFKVAPSLAA